MYKRSYFNGSRTIMDISGISFVTLIKLRFYSCEICSSLENYNLVYCHLIKNEGPPSTCDMLGISATRKRKYLSFPNAKKWRIKYSSIPMTE